MRKSAAFAIVLASFVTGACSNMSSPTSPSTTVSAMAASVGNGATTNATMNWDRTAPGCAPIRPAPEVAGPPTHARTLHEGELYFRPGAIAAEWLRENDTLWAVFYESPAGHELCLWDTAGI